MGLRNETSSISCCNYMLLCALVLLSSQVVAAADNEDTCINSIVPCAPYLNATTKPPSNCCEPLLNVISTQQQCLCNLLTSDVISQFNVNITKALEIPTLCGAKNVSTDTCTKGTTVGTPPASGTPS
ncbi:hypothetical protein KI387_025142, partial [Taxus chinensis]